MRTGNVKIGKVGRVGFVEVEITFVEGRARGPGYGSEDVGWEREFLFAAEEMLIERVVESAL